jgi:uncharacterized protein
MKIQSLKNQTWVAHQCFVANSFVTKLRGLIGTRSLPEGQGLLLTRCNDIHMWFMSIPIDVVFIQKQTDTLYRVTSVNSRVQPWKLLPIHDSQAHHTLELPLDTIQRCQLQRGDVLCIA